MDWDEPTSESQVALLMESACGSGECDLYIDERDGERVIACYNCNRTADPLG